MTPFDISPDDLSFTDSDIPVNEEESIVIDVEVDCNTAINYDRSIHSRMETNRQDVLSTSNNIADVGVPNPVRFRNNGWAIILPIRKQIIRLSYRFLLAILIVGM